MYFPVIPQGRIQEGENAKRQKKKYSECIYSCIKNFVLGKVQKECLITHY